MSKHICEAECLCKAVQISIEIDEPDVMVCHCGMCRRWHGGPSLSVHGSTPPKINADAPLSVYPSSDYGERCFCTKCGSTLMWRSDSLSIYSVAAGALKSPPPMKMGTQIYIDKKPDYYDFANDTKKLTEAEFLKMMQEATCG